MNQRWIVLGEAPAAIERIVQELGQTSPRVVCEHVDWLSTRDYPQIHGAALVLPVISPAASQSTVFLERLRSEPLRSPVLAILSDRCQSELVGMAAEVADDFVVMPAHDDEMRSRLIRLVQQ